MTKLENVIADIKAVDASDYAWIFKDGKIRDDVLCGDVIPFLTALLDYEINTTEMAINRLVADADRRWNTYNWNANISHDLDVAEKEINGYVYMAIMVHRLGDVRGNYTDRFLVRFENEYEWFEIESRMQEKEINDRYVADIDIFSEGYSVYDYVKEVDLGEFYELEKSDLLKEIEKID
jgi:hypothetical protein